MIDTSGLTDKQIAHLEEQAAHYRRRNAVKAQIPGLLAEGLNKTQIAAKLGFTVTTIAGMILELECPSKTVSQIRREQKAELEEWRRTRWR